MPVGAIHSEAGDIITVPVALIARDPFHLGREIIPTHGGERAALGFENQSFSKHTEPTIAHFAGRYVNHGRHPPSALCRTRGEIGTHGWRRGGDGQIRKLPNFCRLRGGHYAVGVKRAQHRQNKGALKLLRGLIAVYPRSPESKQDGADILQFILHRASRPSGTGLEIAIDLSLDERLSLQLLRKHCKIRFDEHVVLGIRPVAHIRPLPLLLRPADLRQTCDGLRIVLLNFQGNQQKRPTAIASKVPYPSAESIADLPDRTRPGRRPTPRFLAVDFFCGAGGTTRGLIDAGGFVIAGIDKVATCRRTYVANNGNETLDRRYPTFICKDIFPRSEDYPGGEQAEIFETLDRLIAEARAMAPDVPMVFAICAPCQPFTTLHSSKFKTHRAVKRQKDRSLLAHAHRFVERYRPEYVLSENVAGISSDRFGGIWQDFRQRLDGDYVTGSRVVCASDFGIAQRRRRSILAAARRDLFPGRVPVELDLPEADPEADRLTVAKALEGLPSIGAGELDPDTPNHLTRGLNALNAKRIRYAPAGGSNAYLETTPEGDLSLACHRKVNGKFGQRCFGDTYTRMDPNGPSPTITTRCHSFTNGRFGHHDVTQDRCISMREAARLQSFEDDYVFHPADQLTSVAQQIGNAVPPRLAAFFAGQLVSGKLKGSQTALF